MRCEVIAVEIGRPAVQSPGRILVMDKIIKQSCFEHMQKIDIGIELHIAGLQVCCHSLKLLLRP